MKYFAMTLALIASLGLAACSGTGESWSNERTAGSSADDSFNGSLRK